ncbi:SRPBCC family protein [Pseudonocardia nigra]|uniref:SRPBCC family protein n=1 Tax=Pseudonocardia nigra TaxID=1921578 RepID=UPI001C5F207A|nr:SRPBCC family protein [Pseudonocardia nigra]
MSSLTHAESTVVGSSPEALYDMVADVSRTGEWSPICKTCWWDEGESAREGAWFTGRNQLPERSWETRSQVVVADRGREFAFVVGGSYVRWGFTFAPVEGGTLVTESWEFLPDGIAMFFNRYGKEAQQRITDRTREAHEGIPATLAAIKRIAERESFTSTWRSQSSWPSPVVRMPQRPTDECQSNGRLLEREPAV